MPATVAAVATGTAEFGDTTVPRPTGTVDGDLLLAAHIMDPDSPASSMTPPDGTWTQVGSTHSTTRGSTKLWRKTASGEPASYVFGGDSGSTSIVVLLRVTGHDPASPIDAAPVYDTGAAATSHVAPSISPAGSDSLLVCGAQAQTEGASRTYTPPGGMTEQADLTEPNAAWTAATVATEQLAASGPTGTRAFTISGAEPWNTFTVAIKSAAAGGAQTIAPSGIAPTEAFGSPAVTQTVAPTGLPPTEALGTPTATQTVAPSGLAPTEAFGTPALTTSNVIAPEGIAPTEAFGTPTIPQPQTITPDGIAPTEAFGMPLVAAEGTHFTGWGVPI